MKQEHAAGRSRPAAITLSPPLIDGAAASTAVSGSLHFCAMGLSVRIKTSHTARFVADASGLATLLGVEPAQALTVTPMSWDK